MIVTFTQEDGTRRVWEGFKPDRMMSPEAEAIEKVTGLTFGEWGQALMNGSTIAGRALVWILKKRDGEIIRFRDLAFPVGDLSVALDEDEKALVREALATDTTLDEDDREKALAAIGPAPEPDEDAPSTVDGPGNDPVPAPNGSGPA